MTMPESRLCDHVWAKTHEQQVEVRCPLFMDALQGPQDVVSRLSTITNRKCQMQAYLSFKSQSMNDKC
jgi:hypothetical protein